jgi:hypothetical protein
LRRATADFEFAFASRLKAAPTPYPGIAWR